MMNITRKPCTFNRVFTTLFYLYFRDVSCSENKYLFEQIVISLKIVYIVTQGTSPRKNSNLCFEVHVITRHI